MKPQVQRAVDAYKKVLHAYQTKMKVRHAKVLALLAECEAGEEADLDRVEEASDKVQEAIFGDVEEETDLVPVVQYDDIIADLKDELPDGDISDQEMILKAMLEEAEDE